jgi:hypothetical protein
VGQYIIPPNHLFEPDEAQLAQIERMMRGERTKCSDCSKALVGDYYVGVRGKQVNRLCAACGHQQNNITEYWYFFRMREMKSYREWVDEHNKYIVPTTEYDDGGRNGGYWQVLREILDGYELHGLGRHRCITTKSYIGLANPLDYWGTLMHKDPKYAGKVPFDITF